MISRSSSLMSTAKVGRGGLSLKTKVVMDRSVRVMETPDLMPCGVPRRGEPPRSGGPFGTGSWRIRGGLRPDVEALEDAGEAGRDPDVLQQRLRLPVQGQGRSEVVSGGSGLGGGALDDDELTELARQRVTRQLTDSECQRYLLGSPTASCPEGDEARSGPFQRSRPAIRMLMQASSSTGARRMPRQLAVRVNRTLMI